MMGTTHAVHGAIAGGAAGALSGEPGYVVAGAVLGAFAGFGPDVDHKPAPAGRLLPPVRWAVHGLSWMFGLPKHRGISHTVLFALVVGASTLFFLPWPLALSVSAGWLAALAGDWCTKTSLPYLWWPITSAHGKPKRVRYKFLRVYTGKRMERWVVYPISVLALVAGAVAVVAYLPG